MTGCPRTKETPRRILEAATLVFSLDGVSGATTRKIARVAKVNEVTLFRYFKNKKELLRQVVLKSCESCENVLTGAPIETPEDLLRTVKAHAAAHMRMLRANEEFLRTFCGETTRHPELCRQLFVVSLKPVRRKFIAILRSGQARGLVWKGLDVATAADALTGMLLVGVLRRPLSDSEYSSRRFCKTCQELFLRGITP
jgi:AcrR family transcriptional regulator